MKREHSTMRYTQGCDAVADVTPAAVEPAATIARLASPQPLDVRKFAVHVKQCQIQKFTFDYFMHGIAEESGEVFEAVRAAKAEGMVDKAKTHAVLSEIGDVLWYVTSFSMELGTAMDMPETWPVVEAGAPEPEVQLLAIASKLSGRVKKSMRGDKPLEQFVPAMLQHRDGLLLECAKIAANHQSTLEQCATENVRKLGGRFARNTVFGDGDGR
mmetsp:Transcript_4052/g.7198  ORF Transcript_4052/g.7198 Transcript_4052/m.7198 type:complete len:214 (-) Transcript_4052:200-841(-)